MGLIHVQGPSAPGPGERAEMLDRARAFLSEAGAAADDVVRVDVGDSRGEDRRTALRPELEVVVPLLQSGSLFGGVQGLLLVEAHRLDGSEAEILAGLLDEADLESVAVAIVSEGAVSKPLAQVISARGKTVRVSKVWESSAAKWLAEEIGRRGLRIDETAAQALIQRFGADTAALGQALDQLAEVRGNITSGMILERFRNRPNEPIFHYTDAVARGDVGEALRRLGDLLVHQHPLVVLAALETELRRRSLALVAPDIEGLREMAGAGAGDRWVERVWRQRSRLKDSGLRRALDAVVRADRLLKTTPEDMHRVVMERLTVAMCRWLVGR